MSLKYIKGWVNVTDPPTTDGPVDPGYGQFPPVDPGYGRPGWSPADPGYDQPTYGGRPDNTLPGAPGHVWGALLRWLMRPQINNDPTKPPGRPIIPSNELPPLGGRPPHIWGGGGGHWEPVDPGYGKPPLWAFFLGPDNGLPTPPGLPDNSLPGGSWVPTDPDYGMPVRPGCPGDVPHPPIWGWIPDQPSFPKPTPSPTTTTIYPPTVTVQASGGSGSVNITTDPAGSWTVDPTSVPDWVTLNPMSSPTSDQNLTYSAAVNEINQPKQALIKVNDAIFTINQGAV